MKNKVKNTLLIVGWLVALPAFGFSVNSLWQSPAQAITPEEQAILDAEAAKKKAEEEKLKDKQEDVKDDLEDALKDKAKLESNLGQIQQNVAVKQKVISTTQAVITDTAATIARKEAEIQAALDRLGLQQEILKDILQQMYVAKSQPAVGIVLAGTEFSKAFGNVDNLVTLEDRLISISNDIADSKDKVASEKQELADLKAGKEKVLAATVAQKKELVADQLEVQSDIKEKEATIEELNQKLAELQSDLNVLTGKSYNAKDIREAVEYASSKTGVPKGVLYGFLKMETNLGANTGQCTYEEVEKVAIARYKKYGSKYKASIALLYKREDLFYDLVKKLGYGKNKKVSCSPKGYIGQGGAMGVSQFMSDVWNSYSPRIAANTGNSTPDPWSLTDGVMAMAIKLKGAGATSDSPAAIKKASINYLGTFYANYYNGIVYWSKNYKKLFD